MLPVVLRPAARKDQLDLADAGFERLSRFPDSGTLVRYKHPKLEG